MSPSWMVPASGRCNVAMVRMSVDLPAPFGPRRPNMPFGIVSDTSARARDAVGVRFERLRITSSTGRSWLAFRMPYDQARSAGFQIIYYLVYYQPTRRLFPLLAYPAAAASGSPARIARAIRSCCAIDGRMSPKARI